MSQMRNTPFNLIYEIKGSVTER